MGTPLNPGDVLAGRYRIERVLGEGGMGVVLAAQHLVLGERVAVKLVLPEAARIPGVVERFQREARAASRIQSEHVARVMDVGALDDGSPFLVMEYVEGRDLAAELEARGPLPVEEAVSYVLQAMAGVAEAHALGIVHRDLKPSNLFLARMPNGRALVKVLDFGIAKETGDEDAKNLTSTFSALGSAAYMSPEQVRLAKSADVRTDVWAFGVVLFELLTGQIPFEGESVTAIAAAITADPPRSLRGLRPDVPEALEAAILRCLEKDRDRRTSSLGVLATGMAPFGGRYATMLAGRIAQALGRPSERPPAEEAATPGARKDAVPTVSEWERPRAGSPGSTEQRGLGRRAIVLSVLAGVIGGGIALGTLLRRGNETPGPEAVSSPGVLTAAPIAAAPRPSVDPSAQAVVPAVPSVEGAEGPGASVPGRSPTMTAPGGLGKPHTPTGGRPAPTKPPAQKGGIRKPLVTDL